MGGIQQCCFEEKKYNRKYGLRRLTNSKVIDNTSLVLKNYQKNKKKSPRKKINKNNSDIQLTELMTESNIISNKETQNNNHKNKKEYLDGIQNTYTFNKFKKKNKNKSSSVDISNPIIRKKTYDINDESSHFSKNSSEYRKKKFLKGELVGEGRYGKVYGGLNISNGEIITIKTYNKISDAQKNKIIKNLQKLYNLSHKNIIKAISVSDEDIYDENGQLSIIYESINSKNVEELIKKFGSLDEKIIQKYIKQLLEGLKYLHDNKIYHKNLKPSNILVDNDGTIKLSDCLVDNLILGNAKEIYNNLIKSDKIDYYIPPFFIQSIYEYKNQNNKSIMSNDNISETSDNKNKVIFNDWQSYDLWHLGCIIIEVASQKKPWSHYKISDNKEFLTFLGTTHLTPTIPQKLSIQCQELIKILLNYSMTKEPDIYNTIFNLNFFKMNPINFTYNNNINNNGINEIKSSLSESQVHFMQNEDSNTSISNNFNSESGTQLGLYLAKNKVVNILNNQNNASFSVSYTVDDNNMSFNQSFMNNKINQSFNKINQSFNKINQSINKLNQTINLPKGKTINNININKLNNPMPEVEEAQIEQSPDPVKDDKENNFKFSTK